MERDYSRTGTTSDRDGKVWLQVKSKKGVFVRSDNKKEMSSIVGFVDSLNLKYAEAKPDFDIPAHLYYELVMSARDEDSESLEVKTFILNFPWSYQWAHSLANNFLSFVTNHLDQFLSNDKIVYFQLYPPRSEKGTGTMFINLDEGRTGGLKYNWDKERGEKGWYEEPVPMFTWKEKGPMEDPERDMSAVNEFWLERMVLDIIPVVNGGIPENPFTESQRPYAFVESILDKWNIELSNNHGEEMLKSDLKANEAPDPIVKREPKEEGPEEVPDDLPF